MNYSPFKALETKLIGGVTLNHLCWAALGGGTVKSFVSGRHGTSILCGQVVSLIYTGLIPTGHGVMNGL